MAGAVNEAHVSMPVVRDVTTPDPLTVRPDDDLNAVRQLFERRDFNAVPVVNDQGDLVGLVTRRSFLRLVRDRADAAAPARVRHVMAHRTGSVDPAAPLGAVVEVMSRKRLRSVPVIERIGGRRRLVGMISVGDLLRGLAGSRRA